MYQPIFHPVGRLLADLSTQRCETLFTKGPVVVAVVRSMFEPENLHVIANFYPEAFSNLERVFMPDWVGHGTMKLGNVIGCFTDQPCSDPLYAGLHRAHNLAWDTYLNTTATHDDLVIRRKVRRAFATASEKHKVFSDLGQAYFDFGVHPSTMFEEAREAYVYNQLWDQQARDDLPVDVKLWAMECIDAMHLGAEEPQIEAFQDDGQPYDFPDWGDPDNGLEVRLSKAYAQQYGYAD